MIHIQKREILGGLTKAIEDYINIIRHARDVAKDEGEDVSEEQDEIWVFPDGHVFIGAGGCKNSALCGWQVDSRPALLPV